MIIENSFLLIKKSNKLFYILFPILYLLSKIYSIILSIMKFCYTRGPFYSYRSKVKIISVGNITLGGTGKTPLTEWIVKFLLKNNKKVGIIIRGYKKPKKSNMFDTSYFSLGDEAAMLRENLPQAGVYVGRDKIFSAKRLENDRLQAGIIDDGFQHWRLKRDLDIVVIDSTKDLFNQYLLPLGKLRESVSSLKRADIFVLTKTDVDIDNAENLKKRLKDIKPNAPVVSSVYKPLCFYDIKSRVKIELDSKVLKNKKVFIVAGIVNPLYFDKLISDLGVKIEREFIYPDHHAYTIDDVRIISQLAKEHSVKTVITTQKDAIRLQHLADTFDSIEIFTLKIELVINENESEFSHRLISLFSR